MEQLYYSKGASVSAITRHCVPRQGQGAGGKGAGYCLHVSGICGDPGPWQENVAIPRNSRDFINVFKSRSGDCLKRLMRCSSRVI